MKKAAPTTDAQALLANADWVMRLARRLVRDEHLSKDVAQEVLVAALQRPRGESVRSLRAWLAGVTRNVALQVLAGERGRARREERVARPEAQSSEEATAERLRLHQLLVQAVVELDEPYRSTVSMRYFDDLAPRQIAARLGEPSARVRKRLSRGLEKLRRRLDGEFGSRGSWCVALVRWIRTAGSPSSWVFPVSLGVEMLGTTRIAAAGLGVLGLSAWLGIHLFQTVGATSHAVEPVALGRSVSEAATPAAVAAAPLDAKVSARKALEPGVAADAGALELEVRHASGLPARAATVVLWRPSEVVGHGVTDAAGFVRLESFEGGAELDVLGANVFPHREWLAAGNGRYAIELPDGAWLRGTVLVDGMPPRESIRIGLVNGPAFRENRTPTVPGRYLLANPWGSAGFCSSWTGPGGEFLFGGLPPDWSGRVRVDEAYELEEGASDEILGPSAGFVLRLTSRPAIRGRVVRADSGEPLAHAVCEYAVSYRNCGRAGTGVCDAGGRFRVPLGAEWSEAMPWTATLVFSGPPFLGADVVGRHVLEVSDDLGQGGADLGDVELRSVRDVPFAAIGPGGEPVSGAVAFTTDATRLRSLPTGSGGRGVLRDVLIESDRLVVTAPGYSEQVASIPDRLAGPIEVQLAPVTTLAIRLELPDGGDPRHLTLVLTADADPFAGDRKWESSALQVELGTSEGQGGFHRGDGSGSRTLHFDEAGTIRLAPLRPGIDVRFQLADVAGNPVGDSVAHRIEPGWNDLALTAPFEPRTLHGRVVDEEGRGIPGVRMTPVGGELGNTSMPVYSDADGTFRIEGLYGRSLSLSLAKQGFALAHEPDILLTGAETSLDVVLERGRSLDVVVVDASGRPVSLEHARAYARVRVGEVTLATSDRDDPLHVARAPSGAGTLTLSIDGWELHRPYGADEAEVTVVLPAFGGLQLSAGRLDPSTSYSIAVQAEDGAGPVIYRRLAEPDPAGRTEATARIPVILPGVYTVQLAEAGELATPIARRTVRISAGKTDRIHLSR